MDKTLLKDFQRVFNSPKLNKIFILFSLICTRNFLLPKF